MNRRWIVFVVTLVSAAVAGMGAGSASAAPPICDPGDEDCGGGGGTHTFTRTLTVTAPSPGRVTGTSIDCGAGGTDCTRSETYTQTCDEFGLCDEPSYATATLTASGGPAGYSPNWSGCDSVSSGQCSVTIDEDVTVSLSWVDTTAPSVTFNPPAEAGPATQMTASGSDNSGLVATMRFFVDGVFTASDSSPPFSFDFPEQLYAHGSTHTVTARATDAANNESPAVGDDVTVDKQVSLQLGASPPAGGYTNAATAPLSFTTDADVPAAGRQCRLDGGTFSQCSSPFEPALPEGPRTYEVRATDDVGNIATASRSFTVDRTAPTASFTGGPNEGAIVGTGTVTFEFSATDAAPMTQACSLDGAGFGACTSQGSHTLTDLTNGEHVFAVRISDAAGNARTIQRNFAVQRAEDEVGGPQPPSSVDSKPPTLTASTPKKPLKKGSLVLLLGSDEAATVSVEVRGSKETLAELDPGQEEKVKAKLGKPTMRSLEKSLREKGRAKLKVVLRASDTAGNVTEKTLRVKLRG